MELQEIDSFIYTIYIGNHFYCYRKTYTKLALSILDSLLLVERNNTYCPRLSLQPQSALSRLLQRN